MCKYSNVLQDKGQANTLFANNVLLALACSHRDYISYGTFSAFYAQHEVDKKHSRGKVLSLHLYFFTTAFALDVYLGVSLVDSVDFGPPKIVLHSVVYFILFFLSEDSL